MWLVTLRSSEPTGGAPMPGVIVIPYVLFLLLFVDLKVIVFLVCADVGYCSLDLRMEDLV